MAVDNKRHEADDLLDDVRATSCRRIGRRSSSVAAKDLLVFDAGAKAPKEPKELDKTVVPLDGWQLHFDVRDEWRQMFAEAWRLERDYFYDRGMHGVDWPAMRAKYAPLVDRVTDRAGADRRARQMVGELSALHIFVYGGDLREGRTMCSPARSAPGSSATRRRRIPRGAHLPRRPGSPGRLSPLARPGVDVEEGDVIQQVNGVEALSAPSSASCCGTQAGQQVLLSVKPAAGGAARDVIVVPIDAPAGRQPALRRVGVHATAGGGEDRRRPHRLRAPAGHGRRRHRAVGTRVLSGLRPRRPDHRRPPQPRRQHRQLDPRAAAAEGLVLLAAARRQADLEHAVRLPRAHGRPVRRVHGVRRRGVRRGLPPARARQSDRHAHLGRRDLALLEQLPGRPRHRHAPPRSACTARKARG